MRWLACLALAACYGPSVAEEVPCGEGMTCPNGQKCYGGKCYSTPPIDSAIDAPPDAPPDARFTCSGVDSVLNSPCLNQVSEEGFYFDIGAKKRIGITGFSIMAQGGGTRDIAIYYRSGTHVGFENSPMGWTLVGTTNNFSPAAMDLCPIPVTFIPINFCVEIPAGQRGAFYIVMTGGSGSLEAYDKPLGQVVVEDATLTLYAGRQQTGIGAFIGQVKDNRGFQGVIHTSE